MKVGELYKLGEHVVEVVYLHPQRLDLVVVLLRSDKARIPVKASDLLPYDRRARIRKLRERNEAWRQARIAEVRKQVRETWDFEYRPWLPRSTKRAKRSTELHWLYMAGCKYNRAARRWELPYTRSGTEQ